MGEPIATIELTLSDAEQAALIDGARDRRPVAGLSHNFYRYPARFSPTFARAAIQVFTKPGDTVLDPYVGGGTSLVEALALGRNGIGVDISELAEFVSSVKTAILTTRELDQLTEWTSSLPPLLNLHRPSIHFADYAERGYYKHLDHRSRWRLRKTIEQALGGVFELSSERTKALARCVVLRTAQWALDGRRRLPATAEFRTMLIENATEMIRGARELRAAAERHPEPAMVRVLNRSAVGIETDSRIRAMPKPRLVVTSPPYPGIHVLYHRWQVDGRKETAAPFWIANKLDGSGSSYYTMGDRKYPELRTYFDNLRTIMSSVAAVCDDNTVVAQMVAFQDASWQLPRYLETMEEAGFVEAMLPMLQGDRDGRLWRSVPNRRWYSDQRGETPGSQEVVLIHRKSKTAPMQPSRSDHSDRVLPRPDRPSSGSLGSR